MNFPPAWLARSDGLLCVGGDLSTKRLVLAYKNGIFPWFSENEPILWWSPDPRLVLYPEQIKVSKSLKKKIRQNKVTIRINHAFKQTITACAKPRKNKNEGTWLVEEMIDAYIDLHELGYAHSIETWRENKLVGGLYGISMGGSFFGESMFSRESDASKIALVALSTHLRRHHFDIIDCQVSTDHLMNMGAVEISRNAFLDTIQKSVKREELNAVWTKQINLELN